jgi:HK97 family phage portal protein
MAVFSLKRSVPNVSKAQVAAAAAGNPLVGNFINYTSSYERQAAIQIPTISRARDLICGMVGCLPIRQYSKQWINDDYEDIDLPDDTWFAQPDPNVTRNFMLSWTTDDLLFTGRAFWVVTSRFGNGFPATFTWIPSADVQTLDQAGPMWYGPSKQIVFQGLTLDPNDVVQFISPIQGLLTMGARAIRTNLNLDNSAERFARNQTPAGVLKQTEGEPLSAEELSELAAGFAAARNNNAIAALNQYVDWKESYMDPSKLQLVEARTYQALEMARVANIPPYLVGAPTGSGMTYQNALQARQDLYLFGAKPYIDCIEQTLSMNNVTPRGRYIYLDVDYYLEEANSVPESDNAAPTPAQPTPGSEDMQ